MRLAKGEFKGESRDGKGHGREGAVRLAKGKFKGESRDGKGHGREGAVRLAKGEFKGESRDGKGHGCEGFQPSPVWKRTKRATAPVAPVCKRQGHHVAATSGADAVARRKH